MYVVLMLPLYIFATPILKLVGQTDAIAELAGPLALQFIPQHFCLCFLRFLQHQSKNIIIVWVAAIAFTVHCVLSWLLIYHLNFGLVGAAVSLNIGWWLPAIRLFLCIVLWWLPSNLDWFFKRSNYKPL
ncbi:DETOXIFICATION 28 protein [Nymphaea thermarum]|nr:DETOXIFICATION 28 protein [Nymphaea thermarum]